VGTHLSLIAVPPFWPVLPISKETRVNFTFLKHCVACALENKFIGAHHAHGFRFIVNRRGDGADVVRNRQKIDFLEQSGCVLIRMQTVWSFWGW
jgi:hypothetical protein